MPHFVHDPIRCERAQPKRMLPSLWNGLLRTCGCRLEPAGVEFLLFYVDLGTGYYRQIRGLTNRNPRGYQFSEQLMQVEMKLRALWGRRAIICAGGMTPFGRSCLEGPM